MAIGRSDDLLVTEYDGRSVVDLVDDLTTQVGIRVELRGEAATVNSGATITLLRSDSETLALGSVSVATSGEVSAPVTAANLDTINAVLGDDLVLLFVGTVTDGSVTHQIRHEIPATVVSRAARMAVRYDEITARYGALAKACALPAGQTTFHDQMRIGLRKYRQELDIRCSRGADLPYQDKLTALQVAYCLEAVCVFVDNGKGGDWKERIEYWRDEQARLWSILVTPVETVRRDWGKKPETVAMKITSESYRNRGGADSDVRIGGPF